MPGNTMPFLISNSVKYHASLSFFYSQGLDGGRNDAKNDKANKINSNVQKKKYNHSTF